MTTNAVQFTWKPGASPPPIEAHSDAKLRLLESYLDRYFEVLCAPPRMGIFRIALVDAFAGGGLFQRDGRNRFGSPLVMMEAVRRAQAHVSAARNGALVIEPKFFFVDQDPDAINFLEHTLNTTETAQFFRDAISVRQADSSQALPVIIKEIAEWSRPGYSMFFLDQCGYTDVPNRDVRLIYQSLPKSEAIVTYAFGALYDYLHESAAILTAIAPLELTSDHLRQLLKERAQQAGRYFAGRLLGRLLKEKIGARFMSRFFLRSEAAGRDMWFVHYSKVTRSRLVMSEAHWAIQNASVTQGEASLDMLGFRPNWENQIGLDFIFDDTDQGRIHTALLDDLPHWLERFEVESGITLDSLLALTADNTAATEGQIRTALDGLEAEKAIDIWTPGDRRKQPGALIRPSHRILLARQGSFSF